MKVSVCIATYNRNPEILNQVLNSILRQELSFQSEVIVVDDGSEGTSTREVCRKYPIIYRRIDRPPVQRNPCTARNLSYKEAVGEFIVAQSDEVVHKTGDSLTRLVLEAEANPDSFVLANVFGCKPNGRIRQEYTGLKRQVPYFFLGILQRKDLYAIGGNDEDFADFIGGYEDQWFGNCLTRGLRLKPIYITSVVAHHLYHPRSDTNQTSAKAKEVYLKKYKEAEATGIWMSSGGPWKIKGKRLA